LREAKRRSNPENPLEEQHQTSSQLPGLPRFARNDASHRHTVQNLTLYEKKLTKIVTPQPLANRQRRQRKYPEQGKL
jgi:hypothetical protein